MTEDITARNNPNMLASIKEKINKFIQNMQEDTKIRKEKEMLYWSGRLNKTFKTYEEMLGARDAYLEKIKPRTQGQDSNGGILSKSISPWQLMGLKNE